MEDREDHELMAEEHRGGGSIAQGATGGKIPALAKVTYKDTEQYGEPPTHGQPRTDRELNATFDPVKGTWSDGHCPSCQMPIGMRHVATTDPPDDEQLESEMWGDSEGICEATDGCHVEPDGTCPHGHRSWWLELGLC